MLSGAFAWRFVQHLYPLPRPSERGRPRSIGLRERNQKGRKTIEIQKHKTGEIDLNTSRKNIYSFSCLWGSIRMAFDAPSQSISHRHWRKVLCVVIIGTLPNQIFLRISHQQTPKSKSLALKHSRFLHRKHHSTRLHSRSRSTITYTIVRRHRIG